MQIRKKNNLNKLINSKKAEESVEKSTVTVAEMVIAAVIILILTIVIIRFGSLLFDDPEDQAVEKNFNSLAIAINTMAKSKETFVSNEKDPFAFYMGQGKDYYLLGFDSTGDLSQGFSENILKYNSDPTIIVPYTYFKPTQCKQSACMCLYDKLPGTNSRNRDDDIVTCYKFTGNNIIFLGHNYYNHLVGAVPRQFEDVYKIQHTDTIPDGMNDYKPIAHLFYYRDSTIKRPINMYFEVFTRTDGTKIVYVADKRNYEQFKTLVDKLKAINYPDFYNFIPNYQMRDPNRNFVELPEQPEIGWQYYPTTNYVGSAYCPTEEQDKNFCGEEFLTASKDNNYQIVICCGTYCTGGKACTKTGEETTGIGTCPSRGNANLAYQNTGKYGVYECLAPGEQPQYQTTTSTTTSSSTTTST